jgi:hypothetical protein
MRISSLAMLVMFTLVACEPDESPMADHAAEASASTAVPATMTAVVQPRPLTIAPVGSDMQVVGAERAISVEPVMIEHAVDLQPVTR